MSKVYLEDSTLTNIANAIRAKTGDSELITPANMPTAIGNISGGGGTIHTAVIYPFTRTTISNTYHVSSVGTIKMKDYVTDFSKLVNITLRVGYAGSPSNPGLFVWTKGMGQFDMAEYFSSQPFLNDSAKSLYVQPGWTAFPLITGQAPITSTTGVMDTTAIGTGRVYLVVPNDDNAIRVPIYYYNNTRWQEVDMENTSVWLEAGTGLWLTWED